MQPVETKQIDGLTVSIYQDDCDEGPRQWDNLGKMVCWHSRYNLGDEQPKESPQDWLKALAVELHEKHTGRSFNHYADDIPQERAMATIERYGVILPLYLYDHSGLSISTGGFSCPWDSGQVGYIYCEQGTEGLDKESLCKSLKGEVETYDQYLRGDVYYYTIEDEEGNDFDSCGGFYGFDYCMNEATAIAESITNDKGMYVAAGI